MKGQNRHFTKEVNKKKRMGQLEIHNFFTKKIKQNMVEEQREIKNKMLEGKIVETVESSVFNNMPSVKLSKNA